MKAHTGVDADSGLVHTVRGTARHVHDITEGHSLLYGQKKVVFADAGYQGVDKRPDAKPEIQWHVLMRPGKRKALDKSHAADAMLDAAEKLKASVRAKMEYPFRVIKRQCGYVKMRYRGLKKNTQQLVVLFAVSNPWMVRRKLLTLQGNWARVRLKTGKTP